MTNAHELSSRLLDLLRREQSALAEFLVALAEFDRHRSWVELGHSSLFYYLHRELKLSAGAAYSHPNADVEAILEAGLDLLLERAAKRRGLVKRPRAHVPAEGGSDPRHVPAAVRREVWLRDDRRCQWPTSDGGICGSTHRLELDHIVPVARGGRSTVANLRVTCAFHNDLAARAVYGDSWMDRFTGDGSRPSGRPREDLPNRDQTGP